MPVLQENEHGGAERLYFILGLFVLLATIGLACTQAGPTSIPSQVPKTSPMPATATAMPSAMPTMAKSAAALDVDQLVLTEQDMPRDGFKLNGYERQDNRAAASERSDPDRWMQNFESWGRVDGFNVLFTNGTGDFIDSTVHVYRTEAAARDAFRRELAGCGKTLVHGVSEALLG